MEGGGGQGRGKKGGVEGREREGRIGDKEEREMGKEEGAPRADGMVVGEGATT